MKNLFAKFSKPNKMRLAEIDPQGQNLEKEEIKAQIEALSDELNELQDLLFYAGRHSLLLVLQGMDTSGKDGTIRHIFSLLHAQAASVAAFKVPTPEELAHDFLWRCHAKTPGKGEFRIFNRSHYEDVLVVRVHEFVPEAVWSRRYEHINAFEQGLADASTIIVKVMLHISKEEQEERLLAREQETEKAWKLNVGDWKERRLWDEYQEAYEAVIQSCSTEHAPWYVIPANRKDERDVAITQILVETLRPYRSDWEQHLAELGQKAVAELKEFRSAPQT